MDGDDDTVFYHATESSGACQQIPEVLVNNTVWCHGPNPLPTWGEPCSPPICDSTWVSGSCADSGYNTMNGYSRNATNQTDEFTCTYGQDWSDDVLPPSDSMTWWYGAAQV